MGEIREDTLVKLTEVCWLGRCCVGQRCGRWRGAWASGESAEARIGKDLLGDREDAVSPQCELNMIGAKVRG